MNLILRSLYGGQVNECNRMKFLDLISKDKNKDVN